MSEPRYESRILFPLRSNVALFKTPEGFLALSERLKVATLLYDKLILEGGFYVLQASANGVVEIHEARRTISMEEARKKRAYYEELSRRQPTLEFVFAAKASDSLGAPTPLIGGRTEALYFAEMQSLVEEIDGYNQPWIEWLDGDIERGSLADEWIHQQDHDDLSALNLGDEFGNDFVKSKLIHSLNRDLAFAAVFEATLSSDPLHMSVVARKVDLAGFAPTIQNLVVQAGFPGVKEVPWDEIVDLRDDSGIIEFRSIVDEIENEIALLPEIKDSDDLRGEITRRWLQRFAEVIAATRPSLKQVASDSAKSLILDFIPLPGLGTLATAIGGTRSVHRARQSWLSVFMHLAR